MMVLILIYVPNIHLKEHLILMKNMFGHKFGSIHSKETPSGTNYESKKFLIHQK